MADGRKKSSFGPGHGLGGFDHSGDKDDCSISFEKWAKANGYNKETRTYERDDDD